MRIEAHLAGLVFPAADFVRDARSGELVQYRATLPRALVAPHEVALADALDAGRVTLGVKARGPGVLTSPVRVTSVHPAEDPAFLIVDAEAMPWDVPPKRRLRVLHTPTAAAAVKAFAEVATLPPEVANRLGQLKFPHADKTSLVLPGDGDESDLRRLLASIDAAQTDPALRGLALTGAADPARRPGWVVGWPAAAGWEAVGAVQDRTLSLAERDGVEQVVFGEADCRGTARCRHNRKLTAGGWKAYTARDLPQFNDAGRRIVRLVDRIYEADGKSLGWDSTRYVLPDGEETPTPTAAPLPPWFGVGTVTSLADGWLSAKLPGFDTTDSGDIAHARLITPTSGTNGKRGMHFEPQPNTPVLLGWSGRLTDPVWVLGNVRDQKVELVAASLWLEQATTLRFDALKLEIDKDGSISGKGKLKVEADEIGITGKKPLGIEGGGVRTLHGNGTFHTGG